MQIMSEIAELIKIITDFRDKRNWKQFHNPKDLAISLSLEASEVLEHFQWKSSEEIQEYIQLNKAEISNELADTLYWILLMCHDMNIDISEALKSKMKINATKYPLKKSKGNHTKYNKF